jgi:hypothetical protein
MPFKVLGLGAEEGVREMGRKYAVLKQFLVDSRKLLADAEGALKRFENQKTLGPEQIMELFRPVHSLKGICGMVEEGKPLVTTFHLLENQLPPLLPPRGKVIEEKDWRTQSKKTFQWAARYFDLLEQKLELWQKLGAEDNENRGLVVSFEHHDGRAEVWIPITSILGMAEAPTVGATPETLVQDFIELGTRTKSHEYIDIAYINMLFYT